MSRDHVPRIERLFASLKESGFRPFFANNVFTSVDMNVRIAVHGWLILELSNDSPFWVGIFALVLGTGQLLFSSIAGAIVDRFQRRNVLLAEGIISATVAAGLALATYNDVAELWWAISIAFLTGCQRAVRFTASNRMVYDLVGPHRLVNGVSLWRVSASPMMIFGSLLIGVIIDWVGIWGAFAFMAASLAIGLPFLLFIHVHGSVDSSSTSLFRQTLEGAQLAVRDPSLRTLFSVSVVMETLGFSFLVMIPVMAKNVLETTGTGLGFLHAGVGAGMLGATLLMAAYGDSVSKAKIIVVCATGAGVALVAFALSRSLPLSVVLAGAVMGFLNAYDLSLGAMMQLVSPPHLRGRAVSLHSLAISFTALGGFVIGAVGGVVGVPLVMAVSGGGIIANIALRKRAILGLQERSIESHPL
jgi:MFS family permease